MIIAVGVVGFIVGICFGFFASMLGGGYWKGYKDAFQDGENDNTAERIKVVNEALDIIDGLRNTTLETNAKTPQAGWDFACEELSWRIKSRFLIDVWGE